MGLDISQVKDSAGATVLACDRSGRITAINSTEQAVLFGG